MAPIVAGRRSQWAEMMSRLRGLGIALAQDASSDIQPASSRRTGAPCAANITGILGWSPGVFVMVSIVYTVLCPPREHAAASESAPSAPSASLRHIVTLLPP